MFETNAMVLGQDLARFHPCVGRLEIKRVIELRLFKTAGVFVGANLRTGQSFYLAVVAVLTALTVLIVAGSTLFSRCPG
ncbi:hypothetical protein Bca4012_075489 [Brassica carinata]